MEELTFLKDLLIDNAKKLYGTISPCSTKPSLNECFTKEDNELLFWFNSVDGSTHLLTKTIK